MDNTQDLLWSLSSGKDLDSGVFCGCNEPNAESMDPAGESDSY